MRTALQMLPVILLLLPLAAKAEEAPPESGPSAEAPTPDRGRLRIEGLPVSARLEIDGRPAEGDLLLLPPGTYLVSVFPAAAPPFEAFVEVVAGETVTLRYRSAPIPAPPSPPPLLPPALLSGAGISLAASLTWWLLGDASATAAREIEGRGDIPPADRTRILQELEAREQSRRHAAAAFGVTGAALMSAGVVLLLTSERESPHVAVFPTRDGWGAAITVELP